MPTPSSRTSRRSRMPLRGATVERTLEALRADGPASQAALARRLGLSPATLSNLVRDLRDEGVVEVTRVNGRESRVSLVAREGVIVAVQVGQASCCGALFDFGNLRRHDLSVRLNGDAVTPTHVVELVRRLSRRARVEVTDLAGVTLGVQAPLSQRTGAVARWAEVQLTGWRQVAIADTLSSALGVPVIADNDANLAALAEWTWGVGRGSNAFLYLMCAAGVGGGIVLDGAIYRGSDGLAGELGHVMLDPDGPVCFCGSRGCLAMSVSERAILRALEASGAPQHTLAEVIASARAGDPACHAVLAAAGADLGRAIAGVATLLSPEVVAVGGSLSEAGPLLFDSLLAAPEVAALSASAPTLRIEPAEITTDATLLGGVAAALARAGRGVSELPGWLRPAPPPRQRATR